MFLQPPTRASLQLHPSKRHFALPAHAHLHHTPLLHATYLDELAEVAVLLLPSVQGHKFGFVVVSHARHSLDADGAVVATVQPLVVGNPGNGGVVTGNMGVVSDQS